MDKSAPEDIQLKVLHGFSIDSEHSKDLDDAIWIEKNSLGYEATVLVTDVASEVPIGSQDDQLAQEKGFTVYCRDSVRAPMLPVSISENRVSLVQGKKRKVVATVIQLDHHAEVLGVRFELAYFTNKYRLTHLDVTEIMQDTGHPLYSQMTTGHIIADLLLTQRRESGSLAFYDFKQRLMTTEEGVIVPIEDNHASIGYIIVQEFMILANRLTAKYLSENNIPCLYRNHTANLSAPPLNEVAEEIEQAILHPDLIDLNIVNQRLSLIMSKAESSPYLKGHYGLNLPSYGHFTSPIRRYSDLVNQRVLIAHLKGEVIPYTIKDLNNISESLNNKQLGRKNEQKAYFQSKTDFIALRKLNGISPGKLEDGELYRLLKFFSELEPKYKVLTENALVAQLDDLSLSIKNLGLVVAQSWSLFSETTRIKLIASLQKSLHLMPGLINLLVQKHGWVEPTLQTKQIKLTPSVWEAVINWSIQDKQYTESVQLNGAKKQSEATAMLSVMSEFLGNKIQIIKELPDESKKDVDSINYKGRLFEKCQKHKIDMPEIACNREGLSHAPIFTITASLIFKGTHYDCPPQKAQDRKSAEQLAAKFLLESIDWSVESNRSSLSDDKNPISELQEFCQKVNHPIPDYSFISADSIFICEASISINGHTIQGKGSGGSKSKAKQDCAISILKKI
ncbi:MAG: RNB domain-containing ribonuclease [Methylococcales bacterium]